MTYELRLERMFDATPEEVFDAFVDPAAQGRLHGEGNPDWVVHRTESDVRVGGTSTFVMGPEGEEADVETRTYSVVERPNRIVFRHSMQVAECGRTVETEVTMTFDPRDDGTLLTMVQTGFDSEQDRDDFLGGWPTYLETLRGIVEGERLKARHDTDQPRAGGDEG